MPDAPLASRLRRLPIATVLGREVRVASDRRSRLLGLAHLDRPRVGPGLLIPRCSSVHTFGMRFQLDLYFLDERGDVVLVCRALSPRRFAICRRSVAVLELPAQEGGENLSAGP